MEKTNPKKSRTNETWDFHMRCVLRKILFHRFLYQSFFFQQLNFLLGSQSCQDCSKVSEGISIAIILTALSLSTYRQWFTLNDIFKLCVKHFQLQFIFFIYLFFIRLCEILFHNIAAAGETKIYYEPLVSTDRRLAASLTSFPTFLFFLWTKVKFIGVTWTTPSHVSF